MNPKQPLALAAAGRKNQLRGERWTVEWQQVLNGYVLRGGRYGARLVLGEQPFFSFVLDGVNFGDFPAAAAFDQLGQKEVLGAITLEKLDCKGVALEAVFRAESSLWQEHTFIWRFEKRRAEHFHIVKGRGPLGRCFFFSTGIPGEYDPGDSQGFAYNARINAEFYFNPDTNLGNVEEFRNNQYGTTGLWPEFPVREQLLLEKSQGDFAPSPLCFCFYDGQSAMGVGLGAQPGQYRFASFEYSGARKRGAAFYINYLGYTQAQGEYATPRVSFTFGSGPLDVLEKHIDWCDDRGFSTQFAYEPAPWHRAPVFCGWAEQTVQSYLKNTESGAEATQKNYEEWIAKLEERGVPFSTIVIDDKWQKYYGTFEVDEEKWPDMKGFIDAQHKKGRHVLLWTASYHTQGLPDQMCIFNQEGRRLFANVADPAYEKLMREQITHLVRDVGADGFKEDWIGGCAREAGIPGYGALHGIEMVRRFQWILWDAAHQVKPDALVETQTPHPLFRESSDVLRLNDLWFSTRHVCDTMQTRARVARIAGWQVLDCDNASCTTVKEWFQYMQFQTRLATPALYCVSRTESFYEEIPQGMWSYVAEAWKKYVEENL